MKKNSFSIIFYTANKTSNYFFENIKKQLLKAADGIPIISVSQKPIDLGENVCCGEIGQSQINIYKQALLGAKKANTKYIAFCEDDVLYHSSHFDYTPSERTFAYDDNIWNIYTWTKPPMFSYKGRRNLNGLLCERDLFIEAMEERFAKYDEKNFPKHLFGEPGKYERQLKVTIRDWEFYPTRKPSIAFSHPTELSYAGLGKRKKIGEKPTTILKPWGEANNIIKLYDKKIN
jgi:hypothetical protein